MFFVKFFIFAKINGRAQRPSIPTRNAKLKMQNTKWKISVTRFARTIKIVGEGLRALPKYNCRLQDPKLFNLHSSLFTCQRSSLFTFKLFFGRPMVAPTVFVTYSIVSVTYTTIVGAIINRPRIVAFHLSTNIIFGNQCGASRTPHPTKLCVFVSYA